MLTRIGKSVFYRKNQENCPDSKGQLGISSLLTYVKEDKLKLVVASVLALVSSSLSLIQPSIVNQLIQAAEDKKFNVYNLLIEILMIIILSALISGYQQLLLGQVGEKIVRDTRKNIVASLFQMPISFFSKMRTGDLVSRITADTLLIKSVVSGGIVNLFGSSLMLLGSIIALIIIDPFTFCVSFLIALFSFFASVVVSKPLRSINITLQNITGNLSAELQQVLSSIMLINSNGAQDQVKEQVNTLVDDAYKTGVKLSKLTAFIGPITATLVNVALVSAIIIGGLRTASGQMQLPDLVMFLMFFNMLINPLNQFSSAILQLQQGLAGHKRISEVTNQESETKEKTTDYTVNNRHITNMPTNNLGADIQFENVSFEYQNCKPALRNMSFHARKNEITALVGPSGAGKSTTFYLLERLYNTSSGRILIDNCDINSFSKNQYRSLLGYVDQNASIIFGSVQENLLLGNTKASLEDVLEAIEKVGMSNWLKALPDGLDTKIRSITDLSGGERQRLALARAILRFPRVLLLDEPTASLDSTTEKIIQELLQELKQHMTIIVIAHRFITIEKAAHIVVLNNGEIAGTGNHESLLKSCTLYRDLAYGQQL